MKKRFRYIALLLALLLLPLSCACADTAEAESVTDEATKSIDSSTPVTPPAPKEAYYYALINSEHLTREDCAAIACITASYVDHDVFTVDVKDCDSALEVYELLRADSIARSGTLDGIQIFGTSDMVPSFLMDYKIPIRLNGEETFGTAKSFFTDYFYTNFENDTAMLTALNLADHFASNHEIDFAPRWQVARLALGSGEFSTYVDNYRAYLADLGGISPVAACFAAPTFRYSDEAAIDDLAYFMNRAQAEWNVLDEVHLYATQEGEFPSPVTVLGTCDSEAFRIENAAGVREFFYMGYSRQETLIKTVLTADSVSRSYLLSWDDIDEILSAHPYFLFLFSSATAEGLDFNVVRTALKSGCLGAFAATAAFPNNGVDCAATLEEMQDTGNIFYFLYSYLKALDEGLPRSRAWLAAQQEMQEVLAACAQKSLTTRTTINSGITFC